MWHHVLLCITGAAVPPAAPRTACVPDEACEFGFEIDPLSFLFNLKPDPGHQSRALICGAAGDVLLLLLLWWLLLLCPLLVSAMHTLILGITTALVEQVLVFLLHLSARLQSLSPSLWLHRRLSKG